LKPATIEELISAVSALMHGFKPSWCIAGGWALDLFLGQISRPHEDLEIAIFRQDQTSLHRHLSDWIFQKVVDGRKIVWPADEELKLPIHEIHAYSTKDSQLSLEFLLNERIANDWVFRRDMRIRMPLKDAIILAKENLPILCPAIVLLFKAKNTKPKDEADFRSVREAMSHQQRRWLKESLRACHPTHPWLKELIMDSDPNSRSPSASPESTESYQC